MASSNDSIVLNRKRNIVSALCKRLSIDPKVFLDDRGSDIKSLCVSILKSSQSSSAPENNDELMKWISFAENYPVDSKACFRILNGLNGDLIQKSVIVGGGTEPSEADVIVFSAVHSSVIGLSESDREKVPHLMRWMDYIQFCIGQEVDMSVRNYELLLTSSKLPSVGKEEIGELFEQILLKKVSFEPPVLNAVAKVEAATNTKKTLQGAKDANSSEVGPNTKKSADVKKVAGDNGVAVEKKETAAEKKKVPEKVADEKDKEVSVSLLKIQVGLIRKAWKHPSADSLLVEEIDVGEAKLRQVVSGLAKHCSPDQLMNRRVVLITNVKPGKLRDVMSEGLVLCASNEDHTIVEPLLVPEGAKPGECVSFSGHEGKPEDVLNPKKKQLDKITPHLFTDDKGIATFKGIPFMTSSGPCTSSIIKASIK